MILQNGSRIYIVAPARKVSPNDIRFCIELLKNQGFNVIEGEHLYGSFHQYSGTDEQRLSDLQTALDDTKASAILCAKGGYGCLRLIDKLKFSTFQKHPKWLCGFSDITVLHSHINNVLKMPSLHCTMPTKIMPENAKNASVTTFLEVLQNGKISYNLPANPSNRAGYAKGRLLGGNLSVLYSLLGSVSDVQTAGKILFIEDLDEYLYHIDRMMTALARSGKLAHLAGLVVGGMTDMHDNAIPFGKTAKEIIWEHVQTYNYPVCFDFPAGHIEDNRALILGGNAELYIDNERVKLNMNAL
ncbi:MAG: LD-carboxypeptidase [Bacteroidales bacterium]|jgi:muramoyltetrapeptide carboxypeptidase|nr:LD-carboxypeptidase [Bacteroidales bacterium]